MLFLKERRQEMGIYLALGEKKTNIICQILFEVLTIALIGISIAIFMGDTLATTISRQLLHAELTRPVELDPLADHGGEIWIENWQDLGFDNNLSVEEMLAAFDTSLNFQTIGLVFTVGFGTVMISTVVPIVYVLKLEPKKLLLQ